MKAVPKTFKNVGGGNDDATGADRIANSGKKMQAKGIEGQGRKKLAGSGKENAEISALTLIWITLVFLMNHQEYAPEVTVLSQGCPMESSLTNNTESLSPLLHRTDEDSVSVQIRYESRLRSTKWENITFQSPKPNLCTRHVNHNTRLVRNQEDEQEEGE